MNLPQDSNPYARTNYQQSGPPHKEKSWLPTCLLGCLAIFIVMVLLFVGIGWYAWSNFRAITANTARAVLDQVIESADLPQAERDEISTQIDRVIDAYKEEKISIQQAAQVLEKLAQSDLIVLILLRVAETQYINPSGLTDEEKQEALNILQRVGRGVKDKKISNSDLETITDQVTIDKGNGQRELKPKLTDEELRNVIQDCKRLVEQAEIPDEPYEINLAEEIKNVIDEALPNLDSEVSEELP